MFKSNITKFGNIRPFCKSEYFFKKMLFKISQQNDQLINASSKTSVYLHLRLCKSQKQPQCNGYPCWCSRSIVRTSCLRFFKGTLTVISVDYLHSVPPQNCRKYYLAKPVNEPITLTRVQMRSLIGRDGGLAVALVLLP